jgi:hypothetical protein
MSNTIKLSRTEDSILQLYTKLGTWGCLDNLSESEKGSIKSDLQQISRSTIMDVQYHFNHALVDTYNLKK